jgi:hypothetical protein
MSVKLIVGWFSCGVVSAVACKLLLDKYSANNKVMIVNTPVDEEDEDNIRFKKDCELWFNFPIITAKNSKFPSSSAVDVWEKKKYMSGVKGAPCSYILKKGARYEFELKNKIDWHVLGFGYDEKERHNRFISSERSNVLPILIKEKLTKFDCFDIIKKAGIRLPRVYSLGFPNANCIGCVKSSSPTYWNFVRKFYPHVFASRAIQSRRLGVKLIELHGKRIYLDELLSSDKGGALKTYDCGIFCDT